VGYQFDLVTGAKKSMKKFAKVDKTARCGGFLAGVRNSAPTENHFQGVAARRGVNEQVFKTGFAIDRKPAAQSGKSLSGANEGAVGKVPLPDLARGWFSQASRPVGSDFHAA
jgi:hypothetical protein